jgi:membrane fusion protein (multidrug efflux system)
MEKLIQPSVEKIERRTCSTTQKVPVKMPAIRKSSRRSLWFNYRQALTDRSVVFAFLLFLGAACCFSGCKKEAAAAPPPPAVEVMEIAPTNAPASAEFIGQLDSPQNVEVRARVEAFVDKMLFTEGTEVKEGQPLFRLDDKPIQERLAAAKGSLGEAKAALGKYEKDVARLTPLAQKHAVPQQDLDNALASLDIGKAGVVSAQATVDAAVIDLGYTDIRSPVSGLIGGKQVSIGDLVGKGQPTLLVTISTLDPIWFYCNVSEVDYLKAQSQLERTGQHIEDLPVSLVLSDGSTLTEPGKIVFLDRAVDPKTGTLRMRAQFPNPKRRLRPGMFARLRVDLGAQTNSILVPQRAITELQGKNFVWVVGSDNKSTQRGVQVGNQVGEDVLVSEGLKPGDRIIVEGLQKVRDGTVVKPMTSEEIAQAAGEPQLTPTGATNPTKE